MEKMINSNILHPNENSYNVIWDRLIAKEIEKYKGFFSGVNVISNGKQLIWDRYQNINYRFKESYMRDSSKPLDRHKVSAAYIYAIEWAHILSLEMVDENPLIYHTLNENLAISVGLSLLSSYILMKLDKSTKLSDAKKHTYINRLNNGIRLPKCNHGNYRSNFVGELHFTYKEGNYNLLGLSDKLFLLETYTLGLYDQVLNWD